jgi:hypothetical protein
MGGVGRTGARGHRSPFYISRGRAGLACAAGSVSEARRPRRPVALAGIPQMRRGGRRAKGAGSLLGRTEGEWVGEMRWITIWNRRQRSHGVAPGPNPAPVSPKLEVRGVREPCSLRFLSAVGRRTNHGGDPVEGVPGARERARGVESGGQPRLDVLFRGCQRQASGAMVS